MKTKIKNINIRRGLFLAFAFAMTATLSFLAIHNMTKTDAASFQAGDIISDAVMSNYNSMSESDINNFMHSKNSCNDTNLSKRNRYPNLTYQIRDGHFLCLADQTFNGQSSAHIIWQAAQDYRINPQVLLVLLQKEQSLITDTWPDDQQIRKATGFACTDSAPCDPSKSGFENQIRKAADLYRTVLDGGWTNYPVGNNYVKYHPQDACGGSNVYIANRATSALYRYTPYQPGGTGTYTGSDGKQYSCYSYGNENFFKYFINWFGDTHAIMDIKSVYMPEGTYILNTTAGKALGFSDTNNGAAAKVVNSNNSDISQQFTLERDDYQYFRLHNVASGRYLDVAGANTNDGAQVQLWDGNDTCAQKWSIEIVNEKSYKLRNACSYKSLDVNGAAVNSNDAKIQIWSSNNTSAQQWVFNNLNSAPINNDIYNITTTAGKSLALTSENLVNSTKMVVGELHSAFTERYQLTRSIDGFYNIKNVASGRYLDVTSGGKADGTAVQIYDRNDSCAQRWAIQKNGSGYRLFSACSGKSLDVFDAKINIENTKIQIWSSNNTNAQIWQFNTPMGRTIKDGVYSISSNLSNGSLLDIDGSTWPTDGTNAHIWGENHTNAQKFQVGYNEATGYYTIKGISSNRYLDVSGASRNKGTNVQVWTSNSSCAQKWMVIANNDDTNTLLSACSRLALDVYNGSTKPGSNIQIWDINKSKAQKWNFITTSIAYKTPMIEEGVYNLASGISKNLYLDADGSSLSKNGTNIQIWNKNNTNAQKFQVTFDNISGFYTIKNIATNRNVDLNNAYIKSGSNIQVWSDNNSCAQKWQITSVDQEQYRIASACNTQYSLDVNEAASISGTNVQIWSNNNTAAQKWKLIKQ